MCITVTPAFLGPQFIRVSETDSEGADTEPVFCLQMTAAGIFGVGVWTLAAKNDYEALLGSVMYVTAAGIMIAAGLFAMFVCIFGIIGAIRESRFMILGVSIQHSSNYSDNFCFAQCFTS